LTGSEKDMPKTNIEVQKTLVEMITNFENGKKNIHYDFESLIKDLFQNEKSRRKSDFMKKTSYGNLFALKCGENALLDHIFVEPDFENVHQEDTGTLRMHTKRLCDFVDYLLHFDHELAKSIVVKYKSTLRSIILNKETSEHYSLRILDIDQLFEVGMFKDPLRFGRDGCKTKKDFGRILFLLRNVLKVYGTNYLKRQDQFTDQHPQTSTALLKLLQQHKTDGFDLKLIRPLISYMVHACPATLCMSNEADPLKIQFEDSDPIECEQNPFSFIFLNYKHKNEKWILNLAVQYFSQYEFTKNLVFGDSGDHSVSLLDIMSSGRTHDTEEEYGNKNARRILQYRRLDVHLSERTSRTTRRKRLTHK
jgi:hypothetical protein